MFTHEVCNILHNFIKDEQILETFTYIFKRLNLSANYKMINFKLKAKKLALSFPPKTKTGKLNWRRFCRSKYPNNINMRVCVTKEQNENE